jgi:hypothetical protein
MLLNQIVKLPELGAAKAAGLGQGDRCQPKFGIPFRLLDVDMVRLVAFATEKKKRYPWTRSTSGMRASYQDRARQAIPTQRLGPGQQPHGSAAIPVVRSPPSSSGKHLRATSRGAIV